jgi:hypothetical protein
MDGEPGDFTVSEGHGHPLVGFEINLMNKKELRIPLKEL